MRMAIKIVKNDFQNRLDTLKRSGASGGIPNKPLEEVEIQWRANNNERFVAGKFANESGTVENWTKLSKKTIALKTRQMKKKGKGNAPQMLVDTARLKLSLLSGIHADAFSLLNKKGLELGSKVKYAIYHHKGLGRLPKRPVLTISGGDKKHFEKIFIMWLKGELR